MRTSLAAAGALAVASTAMAQVPTDVLRVVSQLSSRCQSTALSFYASSEYSCLNIQDTIQVVLDYTNSNSNGSIIPPIDQLLTLDCESAGCSNATISRAVDQIIQGCGADLARYNVSSSIVETIGQHYPLAREVACLRTENTTAVSNATIPSSNSTSSSANVSSTNDTVYCATSLLTTVSEKADANLTIPFFLDLYRAYENDTLLDYAKTLNFTSEDLCDECIFGAANLIGTVYPAIGNITLGSLGFAPNATNTSAAVNATGINLGSDPATYNTTLAQVLNSTCSDEGLTWTSNGTLPEGIVLGAENSTFGLPLTYGNETFTPIVPAEPIRSNASSSMTSASSSAAPSGTPSASAAARRNVADVKARWVGQI